MGREPSSFEAHLRSQLGKRGANDRGLHTLHLHPEDEHGTLVRRGRCCCCLPRGVGWVGWREGVGRGRSSGKPAAHRDQAEAGERARLYELRETAEPAALFRGSVCLHFRHQIS